MNELRATTVTIPAWQRDLHVASEAFAVLSLPLLFAAAKAARPPHRGFLTFMAWGTLAVDGYLLCRWLRSPR
jgi:hypothetical protein